MKAIGYKGIGFKTVFRFNDRVEVHSGEYGFAFDKATQKEKAFIPWRTTPVWVGPRCSKDYRVEIRMMPRDIKMLSDGCGYAAQLERLFSTERPLLFIPNLKSVRIKTSTNGEVINREVRDSEWCISAQMIAKVDDKIRQKINEALLDVDHCRIPPKYKDLDKTAISFACQRNGRKLIPEKDGCLYCYLPANDARWGFRFLMNTDMIPNGPRNDIEYSLEVNKYFARVAGEKFFAWIDSLISSNEYDYDSIFELIPDFEECIKHRNEKVVEFVREFQAGFESKLPELRIPSDSGELVVAKDIICDSDEIIKEFGGGFWKRLAMEGSIPYVSLQMSNAFNRFVKQYKEKLGMRELRIEDLVACCNDSESLLKWLSNRMANEKFIKFLADKRRLKIFKDSKIFIDDKGVLGAAKEMYFHEDIEKYLKPFARCFRYLPLSTTCREHFDGEWFKQLNPTYLVCEVLFSDKNESDTRKLLEDVRCSRNFFVFLARNMIQEVREIRYYNYDGKWNGRPVNKYKKLFTTEFLGRLPVVLDDGRVADAILSDKYSLFDKGNSGDEQFEVYKWIDNGWIQSLSFEYFEWDEGHAVRDFLLGKYNFGQKGLQLVHSWDWKGICTGVIDKFKDEILQRMLTCGSDLGFYDFIATYLSTGDIEYSWVKNQLPILLWPNGQSKSGVAGVYLPPENVDIDDEIKSGRLSADIKILNPLLCAEELKERWKGFGCKELCAEELLAENKKAYFEQQKKFLCGEISLDEFVGIQEQFLKSMSVIPLDEWNRKYSSIFDDIKNRILILNKDQTELKMPSELTLGTIYNPRCDHEKFNLPLQYVYDGFSAFGAEDIKMILVALGVEEGFYERDVDFFAEYPEFCKYFWNDYVPRRKVSLPECFVEKLSSSCSVLTQTGALGVPKFLYGFDLIQKVGNLTPTGWQSHVPDVSGLPEKTLEQLKRLEFKTTPYFEDAIDYLLMPDSDKATALEWISECDTLTLQQVEKVNSYRESTNALWEDAQGNLCQVKDVVVIGAENSVNAKALSGCPNVLKIRKLGKAEIREKALRHLGVSIISDADLKRELVKSQKQYDVKKLVLSGLLVYVTCREGEGWKEVFGKYVEELSKCFFIRCDKISLKYNDAMLLENRHFYRDEEARTAYYVGEVQGRRVFERIVESVQKWLGLRGDIEELKDFLDCDTDLAAILVEKCRGLLNDEDFMVELESRSCSLFKKVKNRISGIDGARDDKNDDKSSLISSDENLDDTGKVNDKVLLRRENQSKTVADDDNAEADESVDPMDVFCEKYNVSQIERAQFENIFRNDGLSSEQMCDANRLATMRLYNCMVNNGLHPILSEVDFVHRIGAKAVGSVPEIETKEGIRVHVASAVRGIAYISPYYWRETVAGNCAICAIGGRWADDYNCWRTEQDLKDAMDKQNDLAVIRIDGAGRAEQVSKFFQQENTIDTTHEIYALIRLRNNTKMDLAFTERATMVLGTLEPAENESQEEDY